MKIFSSQYTFDYSWNEVSAANWRKYPNEMSTHVIAVDVTRREVDPVTGILTSERLITCRQKIPSWIMCIIGGDNLSYVREVSQVDPVNKTVIMRSQNMTMSQILSVHETVVYRPEPSDPEHRTRFEQEARITAYTSFQRVCNRIEEWTVERFGQNAQLGRMGFESVLDKVTKKVQEGVFQQLA